MRRYAIAIAALLVAALGVAGCAGPLARLQQQEQVLTGEPIYIGLATSLSGGTAMLGEGNKRGAEIAVDEFNAAGGYNGRPVRLIIEDDRANPDRSAELIQRFVLKDNVVGIIGPANSGNALRHIGFVQDARVVEIIPGATASTMLGQVKGEKSYIFRVTNSDAFQVSTMINWLLDQRRFTKIGLLHDTTGYGLAGRDEVLNQLAKRSVTPVAVEPFTVGTTDMSPHLTKAKEAGAEALILYGVAPEYAAILASRGAMGWQVPVIGAWMLGDPTVKKIVGPLVDKQVYTITSFTIDANERSRAFHQKVVARYGEDIFPMTTAQGYDATRMLLMALKKAGPDREAIRDALENLDGFEGVTAVPAKPFSPTNHEAISASAMKVATYKNGQLTSEN